MRNSLWSIIVVLPFGEAKTQEVQSMWTAYPGDHKCKKEGPLKSMFRKVQEEISGDTEIAVICYKVGIQ